MNLRAMWELYNSVSSWRDFEEVHASVERALTRVTPEQAVDRIYQHLPVECTAEEYPEIRKALLLKAGQWEKWGYPKLAAFARAEVARLDASGG